MVCGIGPTDDSLNGSLNFNTLSAHSGLTNDESASSLASANGGKGRDRPTMVDASANNSSSNMNSSGRISRRDRLKARETLAAAKAAGVEIDAREAVQTAAMVEESLRSIQSQSQSSLGGADGMMKILLENPPK